MAKRKLTESLIRKIISEEKAKLGKEKSTEQAAKDTAEVDADEYGTSKSLEKDIDHAKALKIQEHAYRKALKMLREEKAKRAPKKPKKKTVKMNESQLVEALKNVRVKRAQLRKKINKRI